MVKTAIKIVGAPAGADAVLNQSPVGDTDEPLSYSGAVDRQVVGKSCNTAQAVSGVSHKKREFAAEAGVDPYFRAIYCRVTMTANAIRFTVAYFVFTLLFAVRVLVSMHGNTVDRFNTHRGSAGVGGALGVQPVIESPTAKRGGG